MYEVTKNFEQIATQKQNNASNDPWNVQSYYEHIFPRKTNEKFQIEIHRQE